MDEARAVASNSLLCLIPDASTSIEPMATPSSAAGSCVHLHTPDNASRTSPDTFHFFPELAPELRLKIWNDALPGTYRGVLLFLFGSVSRGVTLETLSPFNLS
jgi:hypothetical protein